MKVLSPGSLFLLVSAAVVGSTAAALVWTSGPGEAGRPAAASAAAGGFVALAAAAGTSIAAGRAAARDAAAGWKVSVLGVAVRMAFVGASLTYATRFPWFRAVPFVLAFLVLYFGTGLWLVLSQEAAPPVSAPPGAHGGSPGEARR